MTIRKYELDIIDRQIIKAGRYICRPLSVGEQDGKLMLWVEIDTQTKTPTGRRYKICVDIAETGRHFKTTGWYIGTVPMKSGLVWQVYFSRLG